MQQIALIADIHGNLPALEAVLDDIDRRSISTIHRLGDLVGKGPSGARVVDICHERCAGFVRVPYDIERAIADAREAGSPEQDAWAFELRTAQYRAQMPQTVSG